MLWDLPVEGTVISEQVSIDMQYKLLADQKQKKGCLLTYSLRCHYDI